MFNQKCGAQVMTMCEILDGLPVCSVFSVVLGQAAAEEEKLSCTVCCPCLPYSASFINTILVSQSLPNLQR